MRISDWSADVGSSDLNVEPARYGGASEGEGPFDPERDRMMTELVDAVTAARQPLFGICRGFQEINVPLGGTSRRDTSATRATERGGQGKGAAGRGDLRGCRHLNEKKTQQQYTW